ncbi:MAG: type II toxin-antitoxin system RelE/ParE family toxin [Reyranellales bacterium]
MPQIIYSRNALPNLESLYRILVDKNPDAALRAIQTIRTKVKTLSRLPRLGRIDPEQPDYRELLIAFGAAGYFARYRPDAKLVVILAIRHMREAGYHIED